MRQRGHACEQLGLDVLTGDQQLDGLDSGGERRVAEILALAGEEARLLALLLPLQRAHELELGLSFELITLDRASRASCRGSRRVPRGAGGAGQTLQLELPCVADLGLALLAAARRDPGERAPVRSGQLERVPQLVVALLGEIARRGGLEDDRERVRRPLRQKAGKQVDVVAADELGPAGRGRRTCRSPPRAASTRSSSPGQRKLWRSTTSAAFVTSIGRQVDSTPAGGPRAASGAAARAPRPVRLRSKARRADGSPNVPWA